MRVRGLAATQQARLLRHKAKVVPIAIAARRPDCQHALIDPGVIRVGFHLADLVAPSAETVRRIDVRDLSAFGRQERG
jgi:hypothetical protein